MKKQDNDRIIFQNEYDAVYWGRITVNGFPYKHISILVMPTDFCNMNCVYCFNERRTNSERKVMSEETLRKIMNISIPYYDDITFIWHGGEPLSVGQAFYEKVLDLQKQANIRNVRIRNSIQTNLTLLDKAYADFFVENGFKIGSSFDGVTNEETRHNTAAILRGHEILKESGGRNGFICVVQSRNINHLIEDYEWFKSKNINYSLNQYLTSDVREDELAVPVDTYVRKLCEFFDVWARDVRCNICVSYFERFVRYILFKEKDLCCYNSCMGKHIGIYFDGRIFPCNRDFPDEFCFGNVHEYSDIRECFESDGFKALVTKAVARRRRCKEECDIFEFCTGGCNSVAQAGGNVEMNNKYVCDTLKGVYKYISEQIRQLVEMGDETPPINPRLLDMLKEAENRD